MTDLTSVDDFTAVEPAEFAKLVKNTSDDQLSALLSGEKRKPILDAIFARMPQLFRPEKAGSTDATIHWTITGGPNGPDTYEVRIADGICRTTSTPTTDQPRLTVTVGPVDFVKVITGNANPMAMFMTGKIKAKGDVALAARAQEWFTLPKA